MGDKTLPMLLVGVLEAARVPYEWWMGLSICPGKTSDGDEGLFVKLVDARFRCLPTATLLLDDVDNNKAEEEGVAVVVVPAAIM